MTEQQAIEAFSAHQKGRGFSRKTIARRACSLRLFSVAVSPLPLIDATGELIEEWLCSYDSPATRRAYRSDLNAFFNWAQRRKLTNVNPVIDTDSIRVPRSLPRPVAPAWLPAVLDAAVPDVRLMVALAAYAGLRVAEIAAVHKSDVDLNSDCPVIAVRCGKGNKDRIVPLHPDLAAMIAPLPAGPLVHVSPGTITRKVGAHLRSLGVEATPHKLRHTFGTELARTSQGNVVLVAKVMGHESIATTMGYIGWAGGPAADAVTAMYPARPAA